MTNKTGALFLILTLCGLSPMSFAQDGKYLKGTLGTSSHWGSGWFNFRNPITFEEGTCLRVSVGGSAKKVLFRLLRLDDVADEAVGIVGGPREVPRKVKRNGEIIVHLKDQFPNISQASIHGKNPWEFDFGRRNGPASLKSIWIIPCPKAIGK